MENLYRCLEQAGHSRDYVRKYILPEWWDDGLASVPANLALAEGYVAKGLGLSFRELRLRRIVPIQEKP